MTWSCQASWPFWAAAGCLAFGVFLGAATGTWVPTLILVVAALGALPFRRIEVTLTTEHLRVAFWPLGWPAVRLALDQVEVIEHIPDLAPMRWGGWGYRGSLKLFRRAAVVLRAGDAVGVGLRGDRRFFVTVDDAAGLAAALHTATGR